MRRWGLLLAGLLAGGCRSQTFGPYSSPRVVGLVVAADTGQGLPGVTVRRLSAEHRVSSPPKGGELLLQKAPVQTDPEGRFELGSERVLSVVRGAGWNMVSLGFQRSGYRPFQTNCPTRHATSDASGEPILDVGRIPLVPVRR